MFNAETDSRLTLYPVDLDALADVDDLDPADVRVYDSATDPSSEGYNKLQNTKQSHSRLVSLLLIPDARPIVLHSLVGVPASILSSESSEFTKQLMKHPYTHIWR